MFVAGYAGLMHLLLCSSVVVMAKMLGILVGMDLKDSFMRDSCASHTVFPSFVGRPKMLDIKAGTSLS